MLPQSMEYAALLTVAAVSILALFYEQLVTCVREPAFWLGGGVFMLLCFSIDVLALHAGWWAFPSSKSLGLAVLRIPVEEFGLFLIVYAGTVSVWKALGVR